MARAYGLYGLAECQKDLRVTKPYAEQRGTHFLSLPYRLAVPLIFTGVILHWLLPQTFVPGIRLVRCDKEENGYVRPQILMSKSGLTAFCAVFLLANCVVLLMGYRKMVLNLLSAKNFSLMISAACHPAPDEADQHLVKVQWGMIVGHRYCAFTSKPAPLAPQRKSNINITPRSS